MELRYGEDKVMRTVALNSEIRSVHPICMNVLNDPVMCRNNQHYFCRSCITKHLTNAHNCPTCQDELTEDTLVQAPRIVLEYLSELRIHCDFFNRGCRDVMKLSDLEHHVSACGFAAVKCSNEGCEEILNKQDKLHHEAEVCEFRRLQCHDCAELKKEVKDINEKMTHDNTKLQKQVDELSEKISKMCEMQTEIMKEVRQMTAEVKQLKKTSQLLLRRSIIIAGGFDGKNYINSVEFFSWPQKTWTFLNPISRRCAYASAVTYQGKVIISGGYDGEKSTNTMETSSCDKSVEWKISPVKLPEVCRRHAAVMYKDSLILSGGKMGSDDEVSDKIYEISMVPPYSTKVLTTMPQPRYDHTMELFEDKLFIFGGYAGGRNHDTVMVYNLVTKKWKMMTPLPFAVDEMATVLWQNNVVVLGGRKQIGGTVDTVVMYNLTTGESKYLPSMKHKRRRCAAVVTGDVIVVMGGCNSKSCYLKSAEAFHLQDQVWEELPDMNETREYASAVVKPN